MQTIRYTKFINGQYPAEEIVFVRWDDLNWFTTDTPATPPGRDPNERFNGRWSKVIISHTSPVEDLIAYERTFWPDVKVEVIEHSNA